MNIKFLIGISFQILRQYLLCLSRGGILLKLNQRWEIFLHRQTERWTDFLFKNLQNEKIDIAINNQGLSGTSLYTTEMERYEYGINDITKFNKNENNLIEVYKKVIKIAHEANMLIYGKTLTPFKGYRLQAEEKNVIKNKVNE